ncbi:MAG: NAD-dependent epimerase/dehydratase family protein [Bacteroides graminisolvens]|nr:NAD-dependent epimerase/dehydratase family protein [Bacteroides graminisolvens]
MNILITGVHGFVGSNLVKALCAKHTVYGVDIVTQHKLGLAKTYSWADLNENRIPAMDVIIHLASGIYHIGDDQTISTNQLIEVICESQERKARIWRIPQYFVRSVVVLGDLFCLPLNKVRFKKLTDTYVVNNSKIKRALGIESLPVNARKGLLDTFNSFKEESDK